MSAHFLASSYNELPGKSFLTPPSPPPSSPPSVTLQNSVICSGAVIESKCNLNECYVGPGVRVPGETKIKNESFSA